MLWHKNHDGSWSSNDGSYVIRSQKTVGARRYDLLHNGAPIVSGFSSVQQAKKSAEEHYNDRHQLDSPERLRNAARIEAAKVKSLQAKYRKK